VGERTLTLSEAATELGVHYMTVYRYVRTGRLKAQRVGGMWRIDAEEVRAPTLAALPPAVRSGEGAGQERIAATVSRLSSRLVAGDEAGAWELVLSSLASATTPAELLLDVVSPSLHAIGEAWASGELSVADEHRASIVVGRLVGRLAPRFNPRGVKHGTVVVAAPAGERHELPVAIGATLLRWAGCDVVEIGADVPAGALARAVAGELATHRSGPFCLALACTTRSSVPAGAEAVREVRAAAPGVMVLFGGSGLQGSDEALDMGADGFTGTRADALVRAVRALG